MVVERLSSERSLVVINFLVQPGGTEGRQAQLEQFSRKAYVYIVDPKETGGLESVRFVGSLRFIGGVHVIVK
jgi:hypothetical protein